MKWGLIGASDIAETRVIGALRLQGHEIVGVMSSSDDRAKAFSSRNDLERSTTSIDQLLSWDVDAVYISTTNELHAQQAVSSARAGKHVLCEKPLAMTVSDCKEMIDVAKQNKVVLATNHHLRNATTNSAIRELVSTGQIGKVHSVQINHAVSLPERLRGWRLKNPEKGAGVVLDIAVHNLDLVRYLLNENLVSATAVVSNLGFNVSGVEDESICIFTSESGVLVATHESFNIQNSIPSVEVFGSEGTIFATRTLSQDPVGDVYLRTSLGEKKVEVPKIENLYTVLLEKFEKAVQTGSKPASDGVDGMEAVKGALAALQSAAEKRTVLLKEVM